MFAVHTIGREEWKLLVFLLKKEKKNSCRDEELNSAHFWSAVTCFKGPIDLGWPFIWFWPNTALCSHVRLPNKPYNLGMWIFFLLNAAGKKTMQQSLAEHFIWVPDAGAVNISDAVFLLLVLKLMFC